MSRMHPGKPPSRRRPAPWSDGWRERLRTTTQSLATRMRETFGFDDPSTRRFLIAAVRRALGEASMKEIEAGVNSPDETEAAIAVTAQAFRIILDGDCIKRADPLAAESFMSVVERALDDLGLGWRTKVRKTTDVVIAFTRQLETSDPASIRAKVLEHAREATGPKSSGESYREEMVSNGDGDEAELTPMVTMWGAFRLLLDAYSIDHLNAAASKDFMEIVERRLDEVLADPDLLSRLGRPVNKD